jgi:hypothetical protein
MNQAAADLIEISIGEMSSWPREILGAFEAREHMLRAYEEHQKRN